MNILTLLSQLPGVQVARHSGGEYTLVMGDGTVRVPTLAEMLAAFKTAKLAAINVECRARLVARFGDALEQNSRVLGVYGAGERDAMLSGISATIDATNTASGAVDAATTIANAEAVAVTWPVI